MEKSEPWLLWAALAVLPLLFYLTILRRHPSGKKPLPPGPTPLPLIGSLLCLGGIYHQKLANLAGVHGPVMMLKLGLSTVVVISSRDAAREAFTKHDQRLAMHAIPDILRARGFTKRAMAFMPSSDPQWKALRGIHSTHIFSPRGLTSVCSIRERKVGELISYLRARAGEEVLVREVVYIGVLNLLSCSFFSVDMAGVGSESAHELHEMVKEFIAMLSTPNISDFFPSLRHLDLQGMRRRMGRLLDNAFRIIDGIIERRLEEDNNNRTNMDKQDDDYLDVLLKLMYADKISRTQVTQMMFDVLVAGAAAINGTIEWVMAELLHNPSVMAKVRAEVARALGSKETIEEDDAESLAYLQCVLKEAMRLHPVSPLLLPRLALEDGVEIDGYTVPKDSTVIFNAWAIMRDPTAWERPGEFLPERFLQLQRSPQLDLRGKDYEFLPFGSGRRLCPGLPLAARVVPFVVASLLHAFEWRLPDGMSAEEMDMTESFSTDNVLAVPLKAVPVVVH